jgi:PEP-CTERM motif
VVVPAAGTLPSRRVIDIGGATVKETEYLMKKFLVLIGLLAIASCAYAGPVTVNFVAFHKGLWQLGYPYSATINGGPVISVMCDDWEHGGLPGQTWQANVTNLGTGDLSLVRFNQFPNALTLYDEVGWLLLQTQVTSPGQWTDINSAAWFIFDTNTPLNPNAQVWLDAAQNEAAIGFPGIDFGRVLIYTPVNQYDTDINGPQELLGLVPEPGTFVLLGTGLAGLLGRKLRK